MAFGPDGGRVIGRNTGVPANWKRYRGGTAGQIWIDENGDGQFRPLLNIRGNLSTPMWLKDRIYFLSDHEGIGNLYSCSLDGTNIMRHSDHEDYYVRNASSDGHSIVYRSGGDLYVYELEQDEVERVNVQWFSPQTQRNRKFVPAANYLESWHLIPEGHSLAITSRGKAFSMGNWEGAVMQYGSTSGPRYRLLDWLNDGETLVAVSDEGGEESFVLLPSDSSKEARFLEGLDIGRPRNLSINPKKDQILFSNHRYELCVLDLDSEELNVIDRGKSTPIAGYDWSPDGQWVVYSLSISHEVSILKLWRASDQKTFPITAPVLRDVMPVFDPQGHYIYFLSYRNFDPVYDNLQFDLNFPQGVKPFLITLQQDLPSPFVPVPGGSKNNNKNSNNNNAGDDLGDSNNGEATGTEDQGEDISQTEREPTVVIDLEGIKNRVLAFPVAEGRYGQIMGLSEGKVIYTRRPIEGSLNRDWLPKEPPAKSTLFLYDFKELEEEKLISGISSFGLSRDGKTLVYRSGNRLRVLKAGTKPKADAGNKPGKKSGWIDLDRIKVAVEPGTEWRQMYREAWRLQRDQFWTADMSQVDWLAVYERYWPLLDRIASRSEFSDLIWEMQGELGTSHAYEIGGEYRPEPRYEVGHLGAEYEFDSQSGGVENYQDHFRG